MMAAFFNRCWLLSGYRDYAYFQRYKTKVAAIQIQKLKQLISENKDTDFGRKYHFHSIRNYRQFADQVPLIENYEILEPYIESIAAGREDVLFPGNPQFFESTSGSTALSKLIPYNAALKREFQKGVNVWMNDLYRHRKEVFGGPAYWSVSPAMKAQYQTAGGIPVGTSTDTAYFHPLTAWLMQYMLVPVPDQVQNKTAHEFYIATWRHLIRYRSLRFISVWSPNFLLRLYAFLQANVEEILSDDSITKKRKEEVRYICRDIFTLSDLFPDLKLLSCWTQAQAKLWMGEISKVLGPLEIQGKGLLSTEGLVSIPIQFDQHVLAYTAHFFEFRDRANGSIVLAEDLQIQSEYEVILTTGGGLYRYCTGDLIACKGFLDKLPVIEFLGRAGAVSDLVGEKLNAHVLPDIFLRALKDRNIAVRTMHLYPVIHPLHAEYLLLVEGQLTVQEAEELASAINIRLMGNPYFGQAIANGQLRPVQPKLMEAGFSDQLFTFYCQEKQIKEGDAKLPLLFSVGALKNLLGY